MKTLHSCTGSSQKKKEVPQSGVVITFPATKILSPAAGFKSLAPFNSIYIKADSFNFNFPLSLSLLLYAAATQHFVVGPT